MHLANVFTIKTNVSPMATTTIVTTTNRSISGNEAKSVTRPHNMTQNKINNNDDFSISIFIERHRVGVSQCVCVCVIKFTIMRKRVLKIPQNAPNEKDVNLWLDKTVREYGGGNLS